MDFFFQFFFAQKVLGDMVALHTDRRTQVETYNKTIYAKVIADIVALISCLCLEEKNAYVNCVFK